MVRSITFGFLGLALASVLATDPAVAGGPFDGTYTGTRRTTVNNNSGKCQNLDRDRTQMVIRDNVVHYEWIGPIEAPVKPDGSFEGSQPGLATVGASGSIMLKGKITGPNLEAQLGSTLCAVHLSLVKG